MGNGRSRSSAPGLMISSETVEFEAVKDWVAYCRTHHASSCGSPSQRSISPLRLINCKTRELASTGCPYVALSYASEVQVVQGRLPSVVPRVVEDAMAVAIALGIPYLWVDRYCIDQSNSEEKEKLINSMDVIYGQAQITVIASVGSGPDYGLSGISVPRTIQHIFRVGPHILVSGKTPREDINMSVWHTRGWTYQEMLLSCRRLVYTESQVYFQCLEMPCLEGLSMEFTSTDRPSWLRCFPNRGIGTTVEELYNRLQEYYRLELSYQADILNGFAGIFNAFRESFPT
jgi:hypothetical protein